MALLPNFVLFAERGMRFALNKTKAAYDRGLTEVTIRGNKRDIAFSKDVEVMLRMHFPIDKVTGTKDKITVKFRLH